MAAKGTKQKQIPEQLWLDICGYILMQDMASEDTLKELYNKIVEGINEKINADLDREYYTKYKTSPSPEEREEARKKYLDSKGIHPNFRW